MAEPIISIYDMLMMRYRQQRKDDFKQQKDLLNNRNQELNQQSNSVTQLKKIRSRFNHIKGSIGTKATQKVSANVVTATHLTQKQPGIIIPQPTNKEVLNRLVTKMTGGNIENRDKQPVESANLSQEPIENATQIRASTSKKRVAVRAKAKIIKSSHASESSNLRTRLALSPRITNRLDKPTAKPAKSSKIKISAEPKTRSRPSTPDAVRSKVRLKTRKSKASTQWKEKESVPIENVVRYRL